MLPFNFGAPALEEWSWTFSDRDTSAILGRGTDVREEGRLKSAPPVRSAAVTNRQACCWT
jgi:hypothetical protein